MFLIVTAFLLVLVLSFVCLLLLTRPSPTEKVIDSRLSQIHVTEEAYFGEGPAIFKQTKLSKVAWIDAMLQRVPAAQAIQGLLTQAGSTWSVGQVVLSSLVSALAGYLACSMFLPVKTLTLASAAGAAMLPVVFLRSKREAAQVNHTDEKPVRQCSPIAADRHW